MELPTTTPIPRSKTNIGQFVYDVDTLTTTLTGSAGQSIYIVGNPFVCHLDVDAFMAGNSVIKNVKIANIEDNPNAEYAQSVELDSGSKIAPTQSFFVETTVPV